VVGFTQRQQATLLTVESEAWALLQAMKEANHRDWDEVQSESDSQVCWLKLFERDVVVTQNLVN
jgi:ribonuclease HI